MRVTPPPCVAIDLPELELISSETDSAISQASALMAKLKLGELSPYVLALSYCTTLV